MPDLSRFHDAQEESYERAFSEICSGLKTTHWMWYVFPQLAGLGTSEMAWRYAIADTQEAQDFLADELLGPRLVRISRAMLAIEGKTAYEVLGSPDDRKLQSSMTLFSRVPGADPVFKEVLGKYYGGEEDPKTLELI